MQPAEWARQLGYVRGFAGYLSATDVRTEIPPVGLLPHRSKRARPYLYSEREVQDLLAAALELPSTWRSTSLRPWMYQNPSASMLAQSPWTQVPGMRDQ